MKVHLLTVLGIILMGCSKHNFSETPFGAGSRYPYLLKTDSGGLLVSWLEPIDSTVFGLFWSEYFENKWTEKNLIYSSKNFFVNWADFSSIFELNDSILVAHWPEMSSKGTYEYDIKIVYSGDRGQTWCDPIVPHRDGKHAEHGFVSFFKNVNQELSMIWLDGREMAGGHGHDHGGNMNLYTTSFDNDFNQSDDIPIDPMVCECCPTSAVQIGNVTIVAYRDRLESEVRDINIIRKINGEWEEPYPVFEDGWEIHGCPVNGPKLAEKDGNVAIVWFTSPSGDSQINIAYSTNKGETFTRPLRIDDGKPQGRVDLLWLDRDNVLVCWLEEYDDKSKIVYRRVDIEGNIFKIKTIEFLDGGRGIGYPQFEIVGDNILFLWTNSVEKTDIQSKWISL